MKTPTELIHEHWGVKPGDVFSLSFTQLSRFITEVQEDAIAAHHDHQISLRILRMLESHETHQKERDKMIAQNIIDATTKGLQDAATNIINHLPPSTTASTPDAAVQGLLSTVDAVSKQLNSAAGPATAAS